MFCVVGIPFPFFFSFLSPQSTIVHPFFLSYHPFAMLSSYKAVDRLRKHSKWVVFRLALISLINMFVLL